MKNTILKKVATLMAVIIMALCCAAFAFAEESTTNNLLELPNQGVEDDVMQVLKPEELEIHLGSDFAYHGFKLELDYGTYPQTIYADKNGVLKLEIGGSDKYVIRHTGEINKTEAETNSVSASEEAVRVTDNSNESTANNLSGENNSNHKFPFGIVIAVAMLVVLGIVTYIIERATSPQKDKKKKG